jgi:hypothetical protein
VADLDHPVSGNRRFDYWLQADGSHVFYTTGSDRITEIEDIPLDAAYVNKEAIMSWITDAGKNLSGSVKTGAGELADFVKDPVEGFDNMGEELRRWRDNIRNLNPAGVSEELWGEGGRFAYPAAAAIMSKRSPTGEPLSDAHKSALRPFFGAVVDKVTVHWGTPPLDKWAADNFSVKLEDTDTEAQTFGYDIYIKYRMGEQGAEYELTGLAHELVHVQQFERYGNSFSNFGYHYFKEYKQANLQYAANDMEEEAYSRQAEFEMARRSPQPAPVSGDLLWYRHDGWQDGAGSWAGDKLVGHRWQEYKSVFATSDGVIYALTEAGNLYWYRHNGWQDGMGSWAGDKLVGHGWQEYKSVFATSDGVIYALTEAGNLYWYRHDGWQDGTGSWAGNKLVGHGWQEYKSVFATSDGVIYALTEAGNLYWYRHNGWQDGTGSWAGDKLVGHGWQEYKSVFATSDGVIYALTEGGNLYWYRHNGWQDGTDSWAGNKLVGHGWQQYESVFASSDGVLYGIMA